MNGYTVCSFGPENAKEYLILDVVVDTKKKEAKLQGFKGDGSCSPFKLWFKSSVPKGGPSSRDI